MILLCVTFEFYVEGQQPLLLENKQCQKQIINMLIV